MSTEPLHTPAEAAQDLRVSERTILNWIATGHLRAARVGPRLYRIPDSELRRLREPESK